MLFILILTLLALFLYNYVKKFSFWSSRGVPQASTWTCLKENLQTILKQKSFREIQLRNYSRPGNSRYIGFYQFGKPMLMIRDPELLKTITVKDREFFTDRQTFITPGNDIFWDNNLFALGGKKWQIMRSTLSPAFTANKMKAMFCLMEESAKDFTKFFEQGPKNQLHVMKDTYRRYATDVIANCAFGVKTDSLLDRDNDFYLNGRITSNFTSFWRSVKIAISMIHDSVTKVLNITAFDPSASEFFLEIVKNQLRIRQEKNITRPDMLHLLLEARKGHLKHEDEKADQSESFATVEESDFGKSTETKVDFSDVDITAQVMFFFVAGFDTVSTGLSFISYELALNPEIQNRLREEINSTYDRCNGVLTYDILIGMKYMDMVISESLRKWPPALFTDRKPAGVYKLKKEEGFDDEPEVLTLDEEMAVSVAINCFHHDEKHYPHPEVFDPERFNDDNKKNIRPYTYLPFGIGPRNCVGSRFALLEMKTLFFHLLRKFEISIHEKTKIPVEIGKGLFNLDSTDGILLEYKRI